MVFQIKQIKLKNSVFNEYSKVTATDIRLFQTGVTELKLEWEKSVHDAWLVMVDQCVLRVDFTVEPDRDMNRAWRYVALCENWNGLEWILKLETWNKMQITRTTNSRVYTFTDQNTTK
jgi:hypothetical protein